MFKLPITSVGYDGKEITRDYYFNLNKGEITKIHISLPDGLDGFIDKMENDPNVNDIVTVFEKIILTSYGEKTLDGRYVKSKEISEAFSATDAYSELFIKFLENEDNFVNKFLEEAINAPLDTIKKIVEENPNPETDSNNKLPDRI